MHVWSRYTFTYFHQSTFKMEELFWLNYLFFCCISDWKQSQKMKRNLKIFQYWKNSLLNNKLTADKNCQINSPGKKGPPVREKSDALNWKWCRWGRTAILLPFCWRPAHLHLTWEVTSGSFIVCLFSLSLSFELAMAINGIYRKGALFLPKNRARTWGCSLKDESLCHS